MQFQWIIFIAILLCLIVIDLGVFNRKNEVIGFHKSIALSCFYFFIACLFGIYVYLHFGYKGAYQYFTGFIIEKAMSLDNIFVISVIFRFFKIPKIYQHKVLFWGIIGVIAFRAILITFGSSLILQFEWMLYILALILAITGIKLIVSVDKEFDVKNFYVYKILKKYIRITKDFKGDNFFIVKQNKLFATPLFVALLLIEIMDFIFALDSVPVIFAITDNMFIIYTSNIFAIMGLRALYFLLENMTQRFIYLKYALSVILILISIKIFIGHFIKIHILWTLGITVGVILSSIILSILKKDYNISKK